MAPFSSSMLLLSEMGSWRPGHHQAGWSFPDLCPPTSSDFQTCKVEVPKFWEEEHGTTSVNICKLHGLPDLPLLHQGTAGSGWNRTTWFHRSPRRTRPPCGGRPACLQRSWPGHDTWLWLPVFVGKLRFIPANYGKWSTYKKLWYDRV